MNEPTPWTLEALRLHMLELREADKEAVSTALAAAKEAVAKAEAAAEERFRSVNEFRGQLSDQAVTFMPRSEYESRHSDLNNRVDQMATTLSEKLEVATQRLGEKLDLTNQHITDVDAGLVKRILAIEAEQNNQKGRSAAYAVAMGVAFSLIAVAMRFL